MTTVLVCGGRDFEDRNLVWRVLDHFLFDDLVHGGCASGADRWADLWARNHGKLVRAYPADWASEGNAAGPLRNKRMLDAEHPDFVIAFRGGRGTESMKALARQAKVPVLEVT